MELYALNGKRLCYNSAFLFANQKAKYKTERESNFKTNYMKTQQNKNSGKRDELATERLN